MVKQLIDVIVPAFIPTRLNLDYLSESVESLKRQTFKSFGVYILLNGSELFADSVHRLVKDSPSMKLINLGPKASGAIARNAGLRLTSSKYVAQLDADDIYHPEKLEKQLTFLEENEWCGLLATSNEVIKRSGSRQPGIDMRNFQSHSQIESRIQDINPICHGSVMFRRSEVFEAKGLYYNELLKPGCIWPEYEKKMWEDWDLWIRCVRAGVKIHVLLDRLYFWREGSSVDR